MSSHGDPDDPPQARIYVPQGPMWDAWTQGGAVKLSIRAMKTQARSLRRARPRPFGFAPGSAHPMPEQIGEAQGPGTLSSEIATMLGFPTAVWTMSILYGDVADPVAPAAEITSDFHPEDDDDDLEEALLDAVQEWAGRATAPEAAAGDSGAGRSHAEVTSAAIDVVVSGRRCQVPMLRRGEFSAFQVRDEGVLVTVLARHMGSPFPDIVRLADLEPMLSALENPDREAIAAAFAGLRRRHIEQMRNQTRHSS